MFMPYLPIPLVFRRMFLSQKVQNFLVKRTKKWKKNKKGSEIEKKIKNVGYLKKENANECEFCGLDAMKLYGNWWKLWDVSNFIWEKLVDICQIYYGSVEQL